MLRHERQGADRHALSGHNPVKWSVSATPGTTSRIQPCLCPRDWYEPTCSSQDFVIGFIFDNFDGDNIDGEYQYLRRPQIEMALKLQKFLIDDPVNGDIALMEFASKVLIYTLNIAYLPSKANDPINNGYDSWGDMVNNTWAGGMSYNQLLDAAWSELCKDCAAYVFESYAYGFSTTVSLNRFQVNYQDLLGNNSLPLACRDGLSQTKAMTLLAAQPPVGLVHTYFECTKSLQSALSSSVGGAIASATLYGTVVWDGCVADRGIFPGIRN